MRCSYDAIGRMGPKRFISKCSLLAVTMPWGGDIGVKAVRLKKSCIKSQNETPSRINIRQHKEPVARLSATSCAKA